MRGKALAALAVMTLGVPIVSGQGTIYASTDVEYVDFGLTVPVVGATLPVSTCFEQPVVQGALAAPAEETKIPLSFSTGFVGCSAYVDWTTVEPFTISGTAAASAFLSCEHASQALEGFFNFRFSLYKDGEQLGDSVQGSATKLCGGPSDLIEFFAEFSVPTTTFETDTVLSWQTLYWYNNPPHGSVDNLYILAGPGYPTGLTVPGLPLPPPPEASGGDDTGPVTVFADAAEESLTVNHSYESPRDATHVFNWTTEGSAWNASWDVAPSEGSVRITITDGAGETVLDEEIDAADDRSEALQATPGDWQVTLAYAGFVGEVRLAIEPQKEEAADDADAADENEAGPGPADEEEADQDASSDDAAAQENDAESPGLGIGVALALLAFALFRRRPE